MNWYLNFEEAVQILYYAERPRWTFRKKKGEKSHKIIYGFSERPIWYPITIEIPTQPLITTETWIQQVDKRKIKLSLRREDDLLLEQWYLEDAWVFNSIKKPSRVLFNNVVLSAIIQYSWARRIK